jgi:hypothetical protein
MIPYNLQKQLDNSNPLYSYKDVVELVAFALIPERTRENYTIGTFQENFPDVFDTKMIEADHLISYS